MATRKIISVNRLFKNIRIGVFFASVVILISSYYTYKTFSSTIDQASLVDHTNTVIHTLEMVISAAKDGETGARGYVITGDSAFLQPYLSSRDAIEKSFSKLEELNNSGNEGHTRLDSLHDLLTERYKQLDALVLTGGHGLDMDSTQLRIIYEGKYIMDELRGLIVEMSNNEKELLHQRYASTQNSVRNAQVIVSIFLVTSVIIIMITFYILSKSQKEVREREVKLRNLFEQVREIIFAIDRNFIITEINPAIYEQLGYKQDEVRNVSFLELCSNELDKMRLREAARTHQALYDFPVSLQTRNGQSFNYLLNLNPAQARGYQGSLFNIEEQQKLQNERLSLDRFANVGKVARIIAHEVRNPLTNINLSVESLRTEHDPQEFNEYMTIIENNSRRINDLITQLLTSTKLTEFSFAKVDMNKLVEETLHMAMDRIKFKNIEVETEFDPEICDVMVDAEKIQIALLNLFVNAIEAMADKGGILKVRTEKIKDKCVIRIEDNGRGINKEDIKNVFQPFYTTKKTGTGLGLATTQNIILNHKATIDLESEVGNGTLFTITLNFEM